MKIVMTFVLLFCLAISDVQTVLAGNTSSKENATAKNVELAKQVIELAKQGKVPDCPVAVGNNFNDVLTEWGKPFRTKHNSKLYINRTSSAIGPVFVFHIKADNTIHTVMTALSCKLHDLKVADFDKLLGVEGREHPNPLYGIYDLGNFFLYFERTGKVQVSSNL